MENKNSLQLLFTAHLDSMISDALAKGLSLDEINFCIDAAKDLAITFHEKS